MSYLNQLRPTIARKSKKRVGRGMGTGVGKTAGRGHKGQTSRSGGYHKVGFEGGQMPIQRRVPKYGFNSLKKRMSESLRVDALNCLDAEMITIDVLKEAGLIRHNTKFVKVYLSGEVSKALVLQGIAISQSAKAAIEAAGGSVQ